MESTAALMSLGDLPQRTKFSSPVSFKHNKLCSPFSILAPGPDVPVVTNFRAAIQILTSREQKEKRKRKKGKLRSQVFIRQIVPICWKPVASETIPCLAGREGNGRERKRLVKVCRVIFIESLGKLTPVLQRGVLVNMFHVMVDNGGDIEEGIMTYSELVKTEQEKLTTEAKRKKEKEKKLRSSVFHRIDTHIGLIFSPHFIDS
jgi:hypothetical protein